MDAGNIAFMLVCSALVFLMTPGLAMFYGGLVRKKNVVNTMMTSIFIIGTGIVMWVLHFLCSVGSALMQVLHLRQTDFLHTHL